MELEDATEWDLESTPLEIKTNSVLGSTDRVAVVLLSDGGRSTGVVYLFFTSTPQYHLSYCIQGNSNFPGTLPSANDKIWRITLNRTADDTEVVIHCNEVEVLNTLLSSTCGNREWSTYWSRDVATIEFSIYDTASDYYRPQPGD